MGAQQTMRSYLVFLFVVLYAVLYATAQARLLIRAHELDESNKMQAYLYQQIDLLKMENASTTNRLKTYSKLSAILSAIDPKAYQRQGNNCLDYSKRLTAALGAAGFQSSIYINKNRNHAWVGLWIEATDGSFVSPNNNLQIIELRDPNMAVVLADPVLSKVPVSTAPFPVLWTK